MELNKHKVFPLEGKVQHYAWGGDRFIPELLGMNNPQAKPFAEYWMGAHDNASAEMVNGSNQRIALNAYIQAFPEETLGKRVAGTFHRLPYLLKVLDVRDMLSIQVHPTKANAEAEYAAEHQKGVPLNAPHRNYKDDNHKPELMLALSEFWLLHGFKAPAALRHALQQTPELQFLIPVFNASGYKTLYQTVMELDDPAVAMHLQPLLDRIIPAYEAGKLQKSQEDFWAARAALTYNEPGKTDRGIFSIYLFNLVNLHPGEAVFQDAGLPHAYLEGQNVEIMANSDNVLRGGLTPKHVDVAELMKHIRFEETVPNILRSTPITRQQSAFLTPAPDFELGKIELAAGEQVSLHAGSATIYLLLHGGLEVREISEHTFTRNAGEAWIAFDQASLDLHASANSLIYCASVPGK